MRNSNMKEELYAGTWLPLARQLSCRRAFARTATKGVFPLICFLKIGFEIECLAWGRGRENQEHQEHRAVPRSAKEWQAVPSSGQQRRGVRQERSGTAMNRRQPDGEPRISLGPCPPCPPPSGLPCPSRSLVPAASFCRTIKVILGCCH